VGTETPASDGHRGFDEEVMAAIDRSGAAARLVIADVSRDGTWLTIPRSEAPMLREWR
jgi:hypothetical protein